MRLLSILFPFLIPWHPTTEDSISHKKGDEILAQNTYRQKESCAFV